MTESEANQIICQWSARVTAIAYGVTVTWRNSLSTMDFGLTMGAVNKIAADADSNPGRRAPTLETLLTAYKRAAAQQAAQQPADGEDRGRQECDHCRNSGMVGIVLASDNADFRPSRHITADEDRHLARFYCRQDYPCPHCRKGRALARTRDIDPRRQEAVAAHGMPTPRSVWTAEDLQHHADHHFLGVPLPSFMVKPISVSGLFGQPGIREMSRAEAAAVLRQPVGRARPEPVASSEDAPLTVINEAREIPMQVYNAVRPRPAADYTEVRSEADWIGPQEDPEPADLAELPAGVEA
jgi:cytochrome c5